MSRQKQGFKCLFSSVGQSTSLVMRRSVVQLCEQAVLCVSHSMAGQRFVGHAVGTKKYTLHCSRQYVPQCAEKSTVSKTYGQWFLYPKITASFFFKTCHISGTRIRQFLRCCNFQLNFENVNSIHLCTFYDHQIPHFILFPIVIKSAKVDYFCRSQNQAQSCNAVEMLYIQYRFVPTGGSRQGTKSCTRLQHGLQSVTQP